MQKRDYDSYVADDEPLDLFKNMANEEMEKSDPFLSPEEQKWKSGVTAASVFVAFAILFFHFL